MIRGHISQLGIYSLIYDFLYSPTDYRKQKEIRAENFLEFLEYSLDILLLTIVYLNNILYIVSKVYSIPLCNSSKYLLFLL